MNNNGINQNINNLQSNQGSQNLNNNKKVIKILF